MLLATSVSSSVVGYFLYLKIDDATVDIKAVVVSLFICCASRAAATSGLPIQMGWEVEILDLLFCELPLEVLLRHILLMLKACLCVLMMSWLSYVVEFPHQAKY